MNDSRHPRGKTDWFALGKSAFASKRPDTDTKDPRLADALCLLSSVRALHEAGYQRIRVDAGLSASGAYWRCYVTTAGNVRTNGHTLLRSEFRDVAKYTTGQGSELFGWKDAAGKTPQELALVFIERFPDLARRGMGRDQAYADWFAGMMVTAATGRLPIFFADFDLDLSKISVPPPSDSDRENEKSTS